MELCLKIVWKFEENLLGGGFEIPKHTSYYRREWEFSSLDLRSFGTVYSRGGTICSDSHYLRLERSS
jgi:hypothetical protein